MYQSLHDLEINRTGLSNLLKYPNTSKYCCTDAIQNTVPETLADSIAPRLRFIFQYSLRTETSHRDWISANICRVCSGRVICIYDKELHTHFLYICVMQTNGSHVSNFHWSHGEKNPPRRQLHPGILFGFLAPWSSVITARPRRYTLPILLRNDL